MMIVLFLSCTKAQAEQKLPIGGNGMIKEIYLAGGCFWGVEGYFRQIPGVKETDTGYANGKTILQTTRDYIRAITPRLLR